MAEKNWQEAAPAAAKPSKLMSKLKVVGIISFIVAAQCAVAYMFLPSGAAVAKADPKREIKARHSDPVEQDEHAEFREVDLGKFSLTAFDPNSDTTVLIDFHLYGTVAVEPPAEGETASTDHGGGHGGHGKAKEGEEPDDSAFGMLFRKNKHRFRDQVIVIIRNAQAPDLADPGLGLIKRQILAKTNSLLGEPLLKEVIFSDFAVVEQ